MRITTVSKCNTYISMYEKSPIMHAWDNPDKPSVVCFQGALRRTLLKWNSC